MPTESISLRIDKDLLHYLETRAKMEHRTLSGLIIHLLSTEYESDDKWWEVSKGDQGRLIAMLSSNTRPYLLDENATREEKHEYYKTWLNQQFGWNV